MSSNNYQPTLVTVSSETISDAVRWVRNRILYTTDRGQMNPREISERWDDGIMGEIASVAVMQFLKDKGRHVISYDQIRRDEYKEPDPGWDVLCSRHDFDEWLDTTDNVKIKPDNAHSFSIKSSRIPKADQDDIHIAIQKRDFKIFKKSDSIDSDLTSDFEVQVYFSLNRSKYNENLVISIDEAMNGDIDLIIHRLKLIDRYGFCYLSGAASRSTIINYSNSLPEKKRYWKSNHAGYEKHMWNAPLSLGVSFATITKL